MRTEGGTLLDELNWSIRIPLLKNRAIRNQLSLALGIPFGILCIVLLAVQAYSGLLMVGGALVLGFLLVMLIFRGTYDVQYALDDKGITCETQNKQKKRVRRMATATFNGNACGQSHNGRCGHDGRRKNKRTASLETIKKG